MLRRPEVCSSQVDLVFVCGRDFALHQFLVDKDAIQRLEIAGEITSIDNLNADQLKLIDYKSHGRLPGEVAV